MLALLLAGCRYEIKVPEAADRAKTECINLCLEAKLGRGTILELDKSPCLSNEVIEDWVCDVAHDPRQDIDNMPENQCSAFREGKAHHFVELDENCEVIKIY